MSVRINVEGRLGNKPELKTTKSGSEFVTFDLAVDDFKGSEKTTIWFSVADFTGASKRMLEVLDKGKLVHVEGVEHVRIFQDRNNQPQIARDIRIHYIEFVRTGAGNGNKNAENLQCGTTLQPQQPAMQQQVAQQPVYQQPVAPQPIQQQPTQQYQQPAQQPQMVAQPQVQQVAQQPVYQQPVAQQPIQQQAVAQQPVYQQAQPAFTGSNGAPANTYEDDLPF